MHCGIPHVRRKRTILKGFALIATISVMVLLVMVALAMLSLATLEQRSQGISNARIEAQTVSDSTYYGTLALIEWTRMKHLMNKMRHDSWS